MPRYIDADKLIAEYDRVHIGPAGGARKLMVDAPTADVVEVVRCRDCDFSVGDGERLPLNCIHANGLYMPAPDDFCSFGKPKGGDE